MERSIEASTTLRAPRSTARYVLRDDPGCAFADGLSEGQRRTREIPTDIVTAVGSGTAVQQEIVVSLGTAGESDDRVTVPVSWRPISHKRLLPGFAGELAVDVDDAGNTRLMLRGSYEVPLGPVGGFGDVLVGRRVARRSLRTLVEDVARRLDAEVDRRARSVFRPAPYPVDLRESPAAESHLG